MSNLSASVQNELRGYGFAVDTCERWISFSKHGKEDVEKNRWKTFGVRKDLYGFADLIAFGQARFLLVQVSSGSGRAEHAAKVQSNDNARAWVQNGGEVWLATVRKVKDGTNRKHYATRWQRLLRNEKEQWTWKEYQTP